MIAHVHPLNNVISLEITDPDQYIANILIACPNSGHAFGSLQTSISDVSLSKG